MFILRSKLFNYASAGQRLVGYVSLANINLVQNIQLTDISDTNFHTIAAVQDLTTSKPNLSWFNRYFSKSTEAVDLLGPEERITVHDYKQILDSGVKHLLIDVRPPEYFSSFNIETSVNLPLKQLLSETGLQQFIGLSKEMNNHGPVYVMCAKGISSQIAVKYLKDKLPPQNLVIKDVIGGITAWREEIDKTS
ncbi:adenylyltransferase and sulfurtransferase MOCS3 [Tetranychus urticae]|uniref:adenylyltransferase and sulfurtransferase MOCS3 n=1 Tax=Tetranychus urticae TaxID=32264 RepID=UPI00077B90D1|nr:adenylyltransferase and sulfurtransferase MOCS3 [Tetranychus urticae]